MKVMFIVNTLGLNEPFGPMLLSAVLKENGHQTKMGVIQEEQDLQERILSWEPDMLCYSMMSMDMNEMILFNNSLRKKVKIFTFLGGSHATLIRDAAVDGIDAICVGEGEDVILDVIDIVGLVNIILGN